MCLKAGREEVRGLDYASVIRQGEKDYISDCIKVSESEYCSCFVIADGREMPKAAEMAAESVISDFEATGVITKSSVPDFFDKAADILKNNELPLCTSMTVLLTDGSAAVWGSIGDCRMYLLRDKYLYEITPDHSEAYALYEAGEIRYPKIRQSNKRYNLTRTLGSGCDISPDVSKPEKIRPGDSFLLCTDGFWENIHERQIEKTLKRSSDAQNWLDRMMKIVDKNIQHKKYSRFRDPICAVTIKV